MTTAYFITHPDVVVDADVPVPEWPLSPRGRERMRATLELEGMRSIAAVYCSAERKARDGGEILGSALGVPVHVVPELGENDRSATGFLPPNEFWPVVEEFFANPTVSVRGWERAIDAQARIASAVEAALASAPADESVAFVAHGGVGCLLLCKLSGAEISREYEQPGAPAGSPPGAGGGYYFTFDRGTMALTSGWEPVDP